MTIPDYLGGGMLVTERGAVRIVDGESAPSMIVPDIAPWEASTGPCPHRSTRWQCGGALLVLCAISRGEAPGIVEEHDCRGCDQGR